MAYTVRDWLGAFALTQIIEVPIYVAAMRQALRTGHAERPRSLAAQIAIAFGASAITHPMVWFVIPRIPPSSFAGSPMAAYVEYVFRAEMFAFLVEGFYFYSLHVVWLRRALVWSLLANGTSVACGFLTSALLGWP